jgi:hypothetical protein
VDYVLENYVFEKVKVSPTFKIWRNLREFHYCHIYNSFVKKNKHIF